MTCMAGLLRDAELERLSSSLAGTTLTQLAAMHNKLSRSELLNVLKDELGVNACCLRGRSC